MPWEHLDSGARIRSRRGSAECSAAAPHDASEEQLVRSHLPVVNYVVSEIAGRIPRHVCRTDLVSAGMAGLAQAAKSYQPDRGVSFQRFASSRIRGAILDELRARDWASRSVRAKARDMAHGHGR